MECPECNGGEFAREAVEVCQVPGCGAEFEVAYPDPIVRAQAEAVLSRRDKLNQNWYPARESLAVLKAENATRGVPFIGGS